MFRKITSNRDPRDTVFSELQKEFAGYFEKAGNGFSKATVRYPKFLFGAMVVSLLVSAALAFTVFRHREPAKKPAISSTHQAAAGAGFSQIIGLSKALGETIRLKAAIDSLTAKQLLTASDSVLLEHDLDRLQHINQQIKPQKNGH